MAERMFLFVPAQAAVAQWLSSFKEFPICQTPASFNLDEVMRKLSEGGKKGGVMGLDVIVYGRIVTPYLMALPWPPKRDGRLIQGRNAEVIAALPTEDPSPSLARGMFAVPTWKGGIDLDQVIPFGASFEDNPMSRDWWDTWLGKFESLLRRLYWKSVVLHMESRIDGHRMFQWSPTVRAAGLLWADEPQPVGEWNRTVQALFGDQPSEEGAPGPVE
jgi:hypothetical protein